MLRIKKKKSVEYRDAIKGKETRRQDRNDLVNVMQ